MASSAKFNADHFANMDTHVAGIIFVYAGKDGNDTAMHFSGKEYEMTAKTQDEFLRVMRNLKNYSLAGERKGNGIAREE